LEQFSVKTHETGEPRSSDAGNISLLQRLKRETQALHEDLERRIDILNRVRTDESYRALLEAFYGVYAPLEAEIERSVSELAPWLPDIRSRMRTASIRSDLRVVGNARPEALPLAVVPGLGSLAEQFGCLYVLEGSTLGGQMIAREVSSRLPYTAENGCSFFASYGAEIGGMWRRFREAVELYAAAHPEEQERVIQSASATFRTFGDWFGGRT
jgi:heme oxygenase